MNRAALSLFGSGLLIATTSAAVPADRRQGYLSPVEFNVTSVIQPAPRKGDPRYETDRKIFRVTRRLLNTPRGALAAADADFGVPALLRDFSCSVGVTLTAENAPRLVTLIQRAGIDTGVRTNAAKEFYRRDRPFTIDRGSICQPASQLYDERQHRMSYDYPSGHTTWGWTWALILSNLAPDRAQRILERGRAYGDSRFICGAHNESAVEAGMLSASATMTLVATKPAYQADLEVARAELAKLRAEGHSPSGCEAEAALVRERVLPALRSR